MKAVKALRWERRPGERRQELIDAALRVFAERGYRSARLEEVALAAGVTKGTIYHYFATKEELLLAAVEHYRALAFGRIDEALSDPSLPVATQIRLLVRNVFADGEGPRRDLLALLLLGVAHELPDLYDRWISDGPMRIAALVTTLVEEGVRRGEFRDGTDAEVGALVLVSGLMLQFVWQRRGGGGALESMAVDENRLIDSAVETFLASLRRSGPLVTRS